METPLDEVTERIQSLEYFSIFLEHVKIIEPPTPTTSGGIIKFQFWDHLKDLVRLIGGERLIVLLKCRQLGVSWLLAAYALWYALSKKGSVILLFSKGELEAIELLAKCRQIYNHLPAYLKLKANPDSLTEMGFPSNMSSIKALPATETAGVGFTASVIICDEWDWHQYARQNFNQSKPAIDAGGQFIGVFTPDKLHPDTLAKTIFRDAMEGRNDFKWLYFPWHVRPGRDQDWYDSTKRNTPPGENLPPELYMEQNYHSSIKEALQPTQTTSAFNHKVLDEMVGDTRNPVKVDGVDPLIVKVYQPFHIGEFYIAASDTAHGVGKDYSVTVVMNVKTGAIVADIMSNRLSVEEFALHSVSLLNLYRNPLWYPEDNEWGRVVINKAQELGYKNFGYSDKKKVGWHTDEKSRMDLWGGLIPAINNHQITIFNLDGLGQFRDIIRNIEKEGRIEAMSSGHDDYPMAIGICWAKKGEVHTEEWVSKPIESLHFRRW